MADTQTPLTRGALRRLASYDAGIPRVASLFVDLDPAAFGTREARESAVNAAADELDKAARAATEELDRDGGQALIADVARVHDYVIGADLADTRGLAVFAGPDDLFAAFHSETPLPSGAQVGSSPAIGALVAAMPDEQWGVLLANSEVARFFRGNTQGFDEEGSFRDHFTGAASRDQHAAEEEARAHASKAADALATGLRRAPVDQLILGGTQESLNALRDELPEDIATLVRGTITVEVETADPAAVLEQARPVIGEYEDGRVTELLGRVQQGVATAGRGAAQPAPVLQALSEQRVETLLLDANFAASGVECERCGWLGVESSSEGCPADCGRLREHEDISEAAIARALAQDAEVVTVRERPELGPHGGIAAVLRF